MSRSTALTSTEELYRRGIATLLATWRDHARCAPGASVVRLPGVVVAAFPDAPERDIYNNAVIDRDLAPAEQVRAIDAMEQRYASAAIDRYAVWVHETEVGIARALEARGYELHETTRAMAIVLSDLAPAERSHPVDAMTWESFLDMSELPPDLLRRGRQTCRLRLLGAHLGGRLAASAAAFDHGTDCGIYNVGTVEHARRRGLAAAVTARQLVDARDRGCLTATLQATPMAERLYATLGFRDLGRILEYVPTAASPSHEERS